MIRPAHALLLLLALSAPGACFSLERENPEQQRYVLDVRREEAEPSAPSGALEVRAFHVASAYSGRPFVYRTGPQAVDTDFYNVFLVPPGLALTELCSHWLQDAGLVRSVALPGDLLQPTHFLEADVLALYGDFREPDEPRAVVEVRFLLLSAGEVRPLLQRTYAAAIPLDGDSPAALIGGWRSAVATIFTDLEEDLRGALDR